MAYHLQIDENRVLDYLADPVHDLSIEDIDKLIALLEGLAETGDFYRNDPSRRCPPGSTHFDADFFFLDSTGRSRGFRFILSDAAAAHGVLRVRFCEAL